MKLHIYDFIISKPRNDNNGIIVKKMVQKNNHCTCRKENDYAIPNLEMPNTENFEIDIYSQRHLHFLLHYHTITYINLLASGNLNEYLVKIDSQAQERFCIIVEKMKQRQGITEQLKVIRQWTQLMNCIRQQADAITFAELIYN